MKNLTVNMIRYLPEIREGRNNKFSIAASVISGRPQFCLNWDGDKFVLFLKKVEK